MSKGACIQKVVLIAIFRLNKRKNTMFLGIVVIPIGKNALLLEFKYFIPIECEKYYSL